VRPRGTLEAVEHHEMRATLRSVETNEIQEVIVGGFPALDTRW
jgi:hypothetical protein